MNFKTDGGPAFPVTACTDPGDAGMTLRDWFAGQALAGICASNAPCNADGKSLPGLLSEAAYVMADAMLKARETPNE